MKPLQVAIPVMFLMAAVAHAPAQISSTAAADVDNPIRISVTNIVAPVLVTDRSGNIVDGIPPAQFHLFDNNKEQNIQVDVAFEPISVVVLIEKAGRVESILPQIKHLGSLLPLVVGDHGEAAVIAFDSRLQLMQDFTQDSDKVKSAIDKITAGNSSARMIDAVDQAVFMLHKRPENNRKIILLVSETRDQGSEGRVRETLIDAQLANVLVYPVDITQLVVRLTEKPIPPRPDPIAVAAQPTIMGQPSTPTTVAQSYGPGLAQFGPLLRRIYKDTKRIFVDSPSEVFAKGTGGAQFSFIRQKKVWKRRFSGSAQEIRSQYLISYRPSNADEPGFHALTVTVQNPRYAAKTRPGYWIGGGKS